MVFDKNFWFYAGLIAFNGWAAYPINFVSMIQGVAIVVLIVLETKRQLRFRKIAAIRRQIALNRVEILILEDMIDNMHTYPADILTYILERSNMMHGLNYENNVNWKRDGF